MKKGILFLLGLMLATLFVTANPSVNIPPGRDNYVVEWVQQDYSETFAFTTGYVPVFCRFLLIKNVSEIEISPGDFSSLNSLKIHFMDYFYLCLESSKTIWLKYVNEFDFSYNKFICNSKIACQITIT